MRAVYESWVFSERTRRSEMRDDELWGSTLTDWHNVAVSAPVVAAIMQFSIIMMTTNLQLLTMII